MSKTAKAESIPDALYKLLSLLKVIKLEHIIQFTALFIASIIYALAMNIFIIPHHMLSGGFAGIGMIIGYITGHDIGALIFLLNIPLFLLSYFHLGKKLTLLSVFSIGTSSIAMSFIPVQEATHDILLSAVFGGVLYGVSLGIIFRFSSSMGGFDIIGLIISKYKDVSLGIITFTFNCILLVIAGFIFGWDMTFYTIIAQFVCTKVIDTIHSKHVKLTVMIVTEHGLELKQALLDRCSRGVTMVDAVGAYTNTNKKVLYTVVTRYELSDVKRLIRTVDNHAFVNITQTVEIMGHFKRT
ncbi:YitT family protein [Priestia taiwanensis]|uniref:Membrane protein n=1 Tax=Priestia taiwanensis TaxID=1347902 RepID=A0A917AT03_9BACI|nr:YitT family protein [Priestia taiwanensis]MBM7364333.1 uncharacterized membrane-anchored protein YitT (DUF2179 family) [Priestia taiwanensis]GGE73550.1 membrane protein [Priestia taiwanensis]